MVRPAVLLALLIPLFPQTSGAQLKPRLGLALLVEVWSTEGGTEGEGQSSFRAAGTAFGVRNDTAYVVTSHHHVRDASQVHVRLTPGGAVLPAQVLLKDPALDVAVLAVPGYTRDPAWSIPARVARVPAQPGLRETVYVIGCPGGTCWVPPERAELGSADTTFLHLQTISIQAGASGGPVVNADGALLGIVLSYDFNEGTAVRWDRVESELRRYGYPVNLPEKRGHRAREATVRAFSYGYPGDGRRTGFRGEVAYRPTADFETAAGITLVSFDGEPLADPDADYQDQYYIGFLFAGVRWEYEISDWKLGRGFPDVFSMGGDLLLPGLGASVEQRTPIDSVGSGDGESAPTRTRVPVAVDWGAAFHGTYRVALTRHLGVSATFTKYALWIADAQNGHEQMEPWSVAIGVDLRDLDPWFRGTVQQIVSPRQR
jgi:hypothetical protein